MLKYPTHVLSQGGSRQIVLMPAFQSPQRPKMKATNSSPEKYYKAHVPCAENIG